MGLKIKDDDHLEEIMNKQKKSGKSQIDLEDSVFSYDMDLEGVNLSSVNLKHSRMSEINLYKANLESADLMGCDLSLTRLSEADCRDADFSFSNLSKALFQKAKLQGAILMGCDLKGALFEGADVTGCDFSGARNLPLSLVDAKGWDKARGLPKEFVHKLSNTSPSRFLSGPTSKNPNVPSQDRSESSVSLALAKELVQAAYEILAQPSSVEDPKIWKRAVDTAKKNKKYKKMWEAGGELKERFYKIANVIYQKMGGKFSKSKEDFKKEAAKKAEKAAKKEASKPEGKPFQKKEAKK